MSAELVDTPTKLEAFLNNVDASAETRAEPLFVDLEGVKLSRYGSLSLVTIMHGSRLPVYLIDVVALGAKAFTHSNARGTTLKSILESASVEKVFFDVRRDSEALFHLFQVRLQGIQDLQLMEVATRTLKKTFLSGLAKCIEKDVGLSFAERQKWLQGKEQGKKLFQPELGGSYEVFNTRPLAAEIEQYCVQDVVLMPKLRNLYLAKLGSSKALSQQVNNETKARIAESQSPVFIEQSKERAKAPAIFSAGVGL